MMKRFLCGTLAAALVVGSVVSASDASATKKVTVPKPAKVFNMNKANKNVVAVTRKGDSAETFTPTDAAKKKAKGGVMPTVNKKKKVQYKKGKNGKALYLDRTYGVQLKGVNVGTGSWTVSFWIQIPNGIGNFSPVFFAATDLKDASAKWVSITKRDDIQETGGSPIIWSHAVEGKSDEFPWYCKNGVNDKGEAEWTWGTAFDSKKWQHVTLVVDHSKKKLTEYGVKGEDGYVKGYNGATYINGKLYGNGVIAKKSVNGSTKFFLGINGWDVPVKAYYDDVTFWKKALTAKQVKQLYKNKGIAK